MKIKLIIINRDNTEDKFIFESLDDLLKFINNYIAEKLIDSNYAEFEYEIIVEE